MTVKQRILNGEPFTFPEGFFAHDVIISTWYSIECSEADEYGYKAGQPKWLREQDRWSGDLYSVMSLGDKWLKVFTFFFKKKMSMKINLDDVIFKTDYEAEMSSELKKLP